MKIDIYKLIMDVVKEEKNNRSDEKISVAIRALLYPLITSSIITLTTGLLYWVFGVFGALFALVYWCLVTLNRKGIGRRLMDEKIRQELDVKEDVNILRETANKVVDQVLKNKGKGI